MDEAIIRWNGKRRFLGTDEAGHTVVMDSRTVDGGDGSGIRPVELVLHGLAGCTAMDVISVLEKKRQDVRSLEVRVRGDQRVDEYPKIYSAIEVEYVVTGYGVSPAAVQRAIELSAEKYCAVRGMLAPDVQIRTTFRIEESPAPGTPARGLS